MKSANKDFSSGRLNAKFNGSFSNLTLIIISTIVLRFDFVELKSPIRNKAPKRCMLY